MPGLSGDATQRGVAEPAERLAPVAVARPSLVAQPPRPHHVGTVSLLCAVAGTIICWVALATGPFSEAQWLRILAAGFEAATVGALADWFAVTALFRHPLGLPIPHTAIIPKRRAKLIESIANVVEHDWLAPEANSGIAV